MLCKLADLNEEQLKAVREFEEDSGKTLLAYSCRDFSMAKVDEDELRKLKNLEDKLCLQLVAVS